MESCSSCELFVKKAQGLAAQPPIDEPGDKAGILETEKVMCEQGVRQNLAQIVDAAMRGCSGTRWFVESSSTPVTEARDHEEYQSREPHSRQIELSNGEA